MSAAKINRKRRDRTEPGRAHPLDVEACERLDRFSAEICDPDTEVTVDPDDSLVSSVDAAIAGLRSL